MNAEQQALIMVRGTIASLTPQDQEKIRAAETAIRKVIQEHGDVAYMAVALIAAEISAS